MGREPGTGSAILAPVRTEIEAWRARGGMRRIFGREVFAAVEPAPAAPGATPLLILHGFPTSSFDFRHALSRLTADRPVVLHDHLGFGLSDKPVDYSYSLIEQADVAIAVWRELGITRGHLLAHDYGTSVATELVARRERGLCPIELASLTLCNGSVHLEMAQLTLAQKALRAPTIGPIFARLANRRMFGVQMRRIFGKPEAVPEEELDAMWELLERAGGCLRAPQLSTYQDDRVRFRERWIGSLERLDLPAHVLWGRRDPIAVPAIAQKLAGEIPRAKLTWLDDLGHYPMVEDAPRWADAAASFLRNAEQ
jgi:pimeloyl-ACP methyl ester carboxylesterase